MELLLRRWQQIKDGEGRVVLLSGEPGIGKSRLTAALEEQPQAGSRMSACVTSANRITKAARCSRSWRSSSMPRVSRANDTHSRSSAPSSKRCWRRSDAQGVTDVDLFAELLGLGRAADPAETIDPQRKRRRVLAALIEQLEALTRHGPVLMLFEDAHWADPTSIELLTLTIERLQTLPILPRHHAFARTISRPGPGSRTSRC